MRTVSVLGLTIAMMFLGAPAGHAITVEFAGTLEGGQEVPPVATLASGAYTATLTGDFGSDNFVLTYSIDYSGLSAVATAGHIHNAVAGINGPVVHFLDMSPFNFIGTTTGAITGDWRYDDASPYALTETRAQALIDGETYINLHNANYPGGEIRGQINAVPLPGAALLMVTGLACLAGVRAGRRKQAA